jgi:hypothetical protein
MNKPVQTVVPGTKLPKKPRKPRGPSKKTKQALDDAYHAGLNASRDPWPGAFAAIIVAVVAFVAGALIY